MSIHQRSGPAAAITELRKRRLDVAFTEGCEHSAAEALIDFNTENRTECCSMDPKDIKLGVGLDIGSKYTAVCAWQRQSSYKWRDLHDTLLKAVPLGFRSSVTTDSNCDRKDETLVAIPVPSGRRTDQLLRVEGAEFGTQAREKLNGPHSRTGYLFFTNFKQMIHPDSEERKRNHDNLDAIFVPSLTVALNGSRSEVSVLDLLSLCIRQAVLQSLAACNMPLTEENLKGISLCLTVPDAADSAVTQFMRRAAERVKYEIPTQSDRTPTVCKMPSRNISIMMESITSGLHAFYKRDKSRNRLFKDINRRLAEMNRSPPHSPEYKKMEAQEDHLFKFLHIDVGAGTQDIAIIKSKLDGEYNLDREATALSSFGGREGGDIIELAVLSFLLKHVFYHTGLNEKYLVDHPSVRYKILWKLREMKCSAFSKNYPMYGMDADEDELEYWSNGLMENGLQEVEILKVDAESHGQHNARFELNLNDLGLKPSIIKEIAQKNRREDDGFTDNGGDCHERRNTNPKRWQPLYFDSGKLPLQIDPLEPGGKIKGLHGITVSEIIDQETEQTVVSVSLPNRLIFLVAAAQARKIEAQVVDSLNRLTALTWNNGRAVAGSRIKPDAIFMSGSGCHNILLRNRIQRLCKDRDITFVQPPENSTHCVKGAAHCALEPDFLQNSEFQLKGSYAVVTRYDKQGVLREYRNFEDDENISNAPNPWKKLKDAMETDVFQYYTPLTECQNGSIVTANAPYFIKDLEEQPLVYTLNPGDVSNFTVCIRERPFTRIDDRPEIIPAKKALNPDFAKGVFSYKNTKREKQYAKVCFRFLHNEALSMVIQFVKSLEEANEVIGTLGVSMRPNEAPETIESSENIVSSSSSASSSARGDGDRRHFWDVPTSTSSSRPAKRTFYDLTEDY